MSFKGVVFAILLFQVDCANETTTGKIAIAKGALSEQEFPVTARLSDDGVIFALPWETSVNEPWLRPANVRVEIREATTQTLLESYTQPVNRDADHLEVLLPHDLDQVATSVSIFTGEDASGEVRRSVAGSILNFQLNVGYEALLPRSIEERPQPDFKSKPPSASELQAIDQKRSEQQ